MRDAAPWQYRVGQGSARTLSGVVLSPCAAALLLPGAGSGQMYGRAKEAVGRALERLRKARSTRGHVAEKRFAALEAK